MKRVRTLTLMVALLFSMSAIAVNADENGKPLPSVVVKDLKGKKINIQEIDNEGKPIVISFWATWCTSCIKELSTIADMYEDWQNETGVKVIAVSIDDSRNSKKVAPLVKSKGWKYEVYLDENSDLKRALGVANPPMTFVLDKDKKIVYEHSGFALGDEKHLLEELRKLVNPNPAE